VADVDKRKKAGSPAGELAPRGANSGKSAAETAALIGTHARKVEKARAILDLAEAGDMEERDAVLAAEMSINRAAKRVQKKGSSGSSVREFDTDASRCVLTRC
jgi:hypothetical protein